MRIGSEKGHGIVMAERTERKYRVGILHTDRMINMITKTNDRKQISKAKALQVLDILEETYPDARPELDFTNRFELLIATILSAQCTDVRVNLVTAELFKEFNTPETMLTLSVEELGGRIKSCGLHTMKAPNILGTCRLLLERHGGEVPGTLEALTALPGVGRKTANVVLSNGFGVPAIAVDTHVQRVSNRIGLAVSESVEKTEQQLMKIIPRSRWSHSHHLLIFHGRRCCNARKPECERCPLTPLCTYYKSITR